MIVHGLLQERCNYTQKEQIFPVDVDGRCHGMRVYPKNYFYGINWDNWFMSFENINSDILRRFYDAIEDAYIVHFSNQFSNEYLVHLHDRSPYDKLAREYCPKLYNSLDGDF